jgi:DNA repair protein SbcC/Rad50
MVPTAAQLQAEINALPPMPDGDTQLHGSVAQTRTALERAEAKLAQLEADRPSVPATPAVAASASDQELLDLAHALEGQVPGVDPTLEAAAEAARRDLDAARSRGRVATGLFAAAGIAVVVAVALLAGHSAGAGAVVLVLAAVLAVLGVARRRGASSGDAQRRHAEAGARIDAARQQAADAARRRDAAAQRCRELGLDPHPGIIRQAVADRARAANYRTDLADWQERVADLRDQVRTAAAELLRALSARGHLAASPAPDDLAVAVTEYRQACDRRAGQARQASRRADLAAQVEARQQQERRAGTDRQEREAAAVLVAEAAAACGLPAGPAETAAAGLEKWLVQHSEATAAADKARQQAADLEALLNGRSLDELTRGAETTRRRTTELSARADSALVAAAGCRRRSPSPAGSWRTRRTGCTGTSHPSSRPR